MTRYFSWNEQQEAFLSEHYPQKGLKWCAEQLGKTGPSIREKASRLGLKQDANSDFFKDWQRRAAESHKGKKRPDQSILMKNLHAEGKLIQSSEDRAKGGRKLSERWAKEGHPKGFLGGKHTEEAKKQMCIRASKTWSKMTQKQIRDRSIKMVRTRRENGDVNPRKGVTWKCGYREIGGYKKYYRSRWEANYARYLEMLREQGQIKSWKHEPKTFWFDKIKRGTVSYLPDFIVIGLDDSEEYHEVKGWMDPASKTKLKRMRKYFPEITIVLIEKKLYREIEKKLGALISGWEFDKPKVEVKP